MSSIVFVRHSQASLFAEDYDNLSDLGRQQSRQLGEYLQRREVKVDEVYAGPRRRHQQTAEIVTEYAPEIPAVSEQLPEFDEHHVDQLLSDHLDPLADLYPHLAELRSEFHAAEGSRQRQVGFAKLFEAVTDLWVSGQCPLFGVESWAEFADRVNNGIQKLIQRPGRGRRVLVFTSAGTIVAALHRALQCPDNVAMGLGWRIWNCSLTNFAFSGVRFTLHQFNSISHLQDGDYRTYR